MRSTCIRKHMIKYDLLVSELCNKLRESKLSCNSPCEHSFHITDSNSTYSREMWIFHKCGASPLFIKYMRSYSRKMKIK